MTTESQDLGLMSHRKDGAFWQYSVPFTILGLYDPHGPQGEPPNKCDYPVCDGVCLLLCAISDNIAIYGLISQH